MQIQDNPSKPPKIQRRFNSTNQRLKNDQDKEGLPKRKIKEKEKIEQGSGTSQTIFPKPKNNHNSAIEQLGTNQVEDKVNLKDMNKNQKFNIKVPGQNEKQKVENAVLSIVTDFSAIFDNKFSFFTFIKQSNTKFKKYNVNLYLYFQFLKSFVLFLLALCIPTVIRMAIHYTKFNGFFNNGFSASMQVNILRFSVGNIEDAPFNLFGWSVACQTISIIMIMGFIIYWYLQSQKYKKQFKSQIPQPNRYAVSVSGFPYNENNKVDAVIKQIRENDKQNKLYDVIPVYDLKGQLPDIMKIQQLENKKVQQINKASQQNSQQENIQKKQSNQKENPKDKNKSQSQKQIQNQVVNNIDRQINSLKSTVFEQNLKLPLAPLYYILHFKKQEYKQQFMDSYLSTYHLDSWIGTLLRCLSRSQQPKKLKYKDSNQKFHELFIRDIELPCPDNILWENMQVSNGKKIFRRITGLIGLPVITFGIGILVSLVSQQLTKAIIKIDCNNYGNLGKIQVEKNFGNRDMVYCYCLQQFPDFTDICTIKTDFTKEIIISMMSSAATSILSSSVNCILAYLTPIAVSYTLHSTKSKLKNASYWASTFATVANSLFLPLIFSLQFNGISFSSIVDYYTGQQFDGKNVVSFPDLTRDWYMYATPFYFSYLLNSAVICLLQIAQYAIPKISTYLPILKLFTKQSTRTYNQKQGNKLEFNIQSNITLMTVNLFIILSYSSQQPFLIVTGFFVILIQYFSHKTLVLLYCKNVPFEDPEMNHKLLVILPISLLIRCIFSCWCYTCPEIFAKQLFEKTNIWSYIVSEYSYVMERFLEIGIFSVLTIIVALVVVIEFFFVEIYEEASMLIPWFRKKKVLVLETQDFQLKMAKLKQNKIQLLQSYRMQKNQVYRQSWEMIQKYQANLNIKTSMPQTVQKKKQQSVTEDILSCLPVAPTRIRKVQQLISIQICPLPKKQQEIVQRNKSQSIKSSLDVNKNKLKVEDEIQRSTEDKNKTQSNQQKAQYKKSSLPKYKKDLQSDRKNMSKNIQQIIKKDIGPQQQLKVAMNNVDSFMKKTINVIDKLSGQIFDLKQNAPNSNKNNMRTIHPQKQKPEKKKQQEKKQEKQQEKLRKHQQIQKLDNSQTQLLTKQLPHGAEVVMSDIPQDQQHQVFYNQISEFMNSNVPEQVSKFKNTGASKKTPQSKVRNLQIDQEQRLN